MDPLLGQAIRILLLLAKYHWAGDQHKSGCTFDATYECQCGLANVWAIQDEYENRGGRL
jgi:hypothetical protein